jgi:hypothetical protein
MTKKKNTSGGGANTNLNGLSFENKTSFSNLLNQNGNYTFNEHSEVLSGDKVVAKYFEKHKLYSKLLKPRGINYKSIISKKLLPDGAVLVDNKIFIIEKKTQNGAGSVDEKLQTCDFKKKQYSKLFNPIGIDVQFFFLLSSWFNKDCYKDVFEYIESVECKYYFETIPLEKLGL